MKTSPHLLLAAALALGTSFAIAQEETKPQTPQPPQSPPPPQSPGSPLGSGNQRGPEAGRPKDGADRSPEPRAHSPRPEDRERMRDDKDRHDNRDGRPGERDRKDGPRADHERRDDRGHRDGPDHRGDKPHGPKAGQGSERRGHMPVPQKLTPFIGVVTVSPPPVGSAQFSLAPGFGLVVTEVLPDSPAAQAGLQKFDVLTKFNDQHLVDGGQFSTLVRAQAKDTDATLTLFRKAQEQKVNVKIGERMMPERRPFPTTGQIGSEIEKWKEPAMEHAKKFQDHAKIYVERMREFHDRMKDWSRQPTAEKPQPPQIEGGDALRLDSQDILREVRPGGTPLVSLLQPDGAVTYHTRDAKLLMKDDSGEIEVSTRDGQRTLLAKNAAGELIFEGPIDTEEQRQTLPEELRKKVELINAQTRIVRFDAPAFAPFEAEESVQ